MLPFILLDLIAKTHAQSPVAQCLSGTINFDPRRMYALGGVNETLDPSVYDLTIDYGSMNVKPNSNGTGIQVNLVKNANNNGLGARLSTTRYMQYAKITVRMNAIPVNGVVTTFITYSPRKDEIDFEFVGGEKSSVQSNVFYKGIPEFGIRSKTHQVGPIEQIRTYTMDWRSDKITWLIDGKEVRSYSRNSNEALSSGTPAGERSYPTEPTHIQFGVWDGGSSPSSGVAKWAGGPIPWPQGVNSYSAIYESIEIQCYNDKNEPVPKWPNVDSNPTSRSAPASQPTSAADANEARFGGVGANNAIPSVEGLPTTGKNDQGNNSGDLHRSLGYFIPCACLILTFI